MTWPPCLFLWRHRLILSQLTHSAQAMLAISAPGCLQIFCLLGMFALAVCSFSGVLFSQMLSSFPYHFFFFKPDLQRCLPWLLYLKYLSQCNPIIHCPPNLLSFTSKGWRLVFPCSFTYCLPPLLECNLHVDRGFFLFMASPSTAKTALCTQ